MIFILLGILTFVCLGKSSSDPPRATEIPHTIRKFGVDLNDPFHYFSNQSYFETVKEYIDEENKWAEANVYEDKLVDILKNELEIYQSSSLDTDEYIAEFPNKDLEYYKFEPLKGYGRWYRRPIGSKEEGEMILDENELFEMLGKPDFFSLARIAPSPTHKIIAFLYDTSGDEKHTIGFRDLTSQSYLPDTLEHSYYGIVWSTDSKRILYERLKSLPNQPLAIHAYEIGSGEPTIEVFTSTDDTVEVDLTLSTDRKIVIIKEDSFHGIRNFIIRLESFNETDVSRYIYEFPIMYQTDIEYYIDHSPLGYIVRRQNEVDSNFGVYLYNETNGFSVTTIREESEDVIITQIDCFHSLFYVWGYNTTSIKPFVEMYSNNDLSNPLSLDFDSLRSSQNEKYAIQPYYDDWFPVLGGSRGYLLSQLKFIYSSLITPPRTYVFDVNAKDEDRYSSNSNHMKLIDSVVIQGFDSTMYSDDVIFVSYVSSTTGTPEKVDIPVSLCYKSYEYVDGVRKPLELKQRPVWVYSYGSYGSIIQPRFRDYMIPILDRNFVFAIAHVRGSSIKGMKYYHDGYRRKKKSTWEDLNAVLEHFKESGIARDNEIVIEGASAGGLTVGRAMISRRDLMNVTIATVPFVDCLNTMSDRTQPYTIMEWTQWGDPMNNQDDFEYIHSYDPYYTFTEEKDYPNFYLQAGINDNRVRFWEPLKFIAKLRSWNVEKENTQVIRVYAGGHFGASEGSDARVNRAKVQAFVIQKILGWSEDDQDGREKSGVYSERITTFMVVMFVFGICVCLCWGGCVFVVCCVGGFGMIGCCLYFGFIRKNVRRERGTRYRYRDLFDEGGKEFDEEDLVGMELEEVENLSI